MKERLAESSQPSAFDLVEGAVALLREAPAICFLSYFLGSIPFWLALLYFVSDMAQSGDAPARLAASSFLTAVGFLWMKVWHTAFAASLRATAFRERPEIWTAQRILRTALLQASVQPWGLVLRPIALLLTLPFVWVSSFYHNATILGDSALATSSSAMRRSWEQALVWPGQAHLAATFLGIFGFFIWVNVTAFLVSIPFLMKALFGVETAVSRAGVGSLFNWTFFTVTMALTVMCLDPLWKAAWVLRCFFSEARASGVDLRIRLGRSPAGASSLLLLLSLFLWGAAAPCGEAQPLAGAGGSPPAAAAVNARKLETSIREVLSRREYAWRFPREQEVAKARSKSTFSRIFQKEMEKLKRWSSRMWRAISRLWKKRNHADVPQGEGHLSYRIGLYGLVAAGCLLLAWVLVRLRTEKTPLTVTAEAVEALPDLGREDVAADELPEEGWLRYARQLMEQGDFRLAIRASYLACLAHLSSRELLTIARHKSNRDYARELHRRARSREGLLDAFDENLLAFEKTWYGRHSATSTLLELLTSNLERMRVC